jgi:hypothetical protein
VSRRRYIALAAVAAGIVVAIVAWKVFPRDQVSKATVAEALQEFRGAGGPGGRQGKGPELGVYRYTTRGGETLNSNFADAKHDYGGVSTVAITPGPCGDVERWSVLLQRWNEAEVCLGPDGSRLKSLRVFHEFFGVGKAPDYICRGKPTPYAKDLRVGMSWTTKCRADKSSVSTEVNVEGLESVRVGARAFDSVKITARSVVEGDPSGSGEVREWRRRSDGLLLRRTAESKAKVSQGGGGHITENYSLDLISPEPQR